MATKSSQLRETAKGLKSRTETTTAEVDSDSSQSETEDDSDYDSSEDEELEVHDPSPLPPTRPTDPIEAVKYDTTKALWRSAKRGLSGGEIKSALGEYWQVVKTIRDKWNTLEKSETDKKGNIPAIKGRISQQRDLLAASITSALETGHKDIIARYVQSFLPFDST